jgi:7-cyano-7-deazaguanine reductase
MTDHKPQLGAETHYPEHYDPELLVSIPRSGSRAALEIPAAMYGVDIWTGYELSWLTAKGKPRVAIAEFQISCDSPYIVESKSFKLYLNSLNQCRIASEQALLELMRKDLSLGFGADVAIALFTLDEFATRGVTRLPGDCLDDLDIPCDEYAANPDLLSADDADRAVESLYSHLLKTNCPVTGQPDWASISVQYKGARINREGLLQYLVSFRQHQDFHENCVETIFCDLMSRCGPEELTVYARYSRRGGLDINPCRSTHPVNLEGCRLSRQ